MDMLGRILVWPTATKSEIENHAEYWKARAEKYEWNGDAANAGADWLRYFALNPNAPDQKRFEILTKHAQWQAAAEAGSRMVAKTPDQGQLWQRVAPVIALAGNEEHYRQFCDRMVAQFTDTTNQDAAEKTCKVCCLIPGAVDLSRLPLEPLAEPLDQGTAQARVRPWAWAVRALVAFRKGDADSAIRYMEQSQQQNAREDERVRALIAAIRALVQAKQGQTDEARDNLATVSEISDRTMPNANAASLHDWLIPRILAREAEKLLDGEKQAERGSTGPPRSIDSAGAAMAR
jgi:tetratricopeptide (TPR) repeat protein